MNDKPEDSKGGPEVTRRGMLGLFLGAGAASAAGNVPAVDALAKLASSSGTISNFFGVPDMLKMGHLLSQVTNIFSNPAGTELLNLMDSRRVLLGTLDHEGIDIAFARYITSIRPFMEKQHAYETFMRGAVDKAMATDHFMSGLLSDEKIALEDIVRDLSADHPSFKPDQIQRLGGFLLRMVKAQGGKGLDSGIFTLFEGQSPEAFIQNSLRNAIDSVLEDQVLPLPSPTEMFRSIVLDNAEHMQSIGHPLSRTLFDQLKLEKEFGGYENFEQEVEKFAEARDNEIESPDKQEES
ncbi:MAG: hypothetical protein ACOYJ2_08845 [Rickettsiales bacterium]